MLYNVSDDGTHYGTRDGSYDGRLGERIGGNVEIVAVYQRIF